jgi:hypothetical protein
MRGREVISNCGKKLGGNTMHKIDLFFLSEWFTNWTLKSIKIKWRFIAVVPNEFRAVL